MTFNKDLSFGQSYEVLYSTMKNLNEPIISKGKFSKYDIISDNIKYEVKADRKAYSTGNLCIEYQCNNKPSGISVTEADFYCYFIIKDNNNFDLYEIPVSFIKEQINLKSYKRTMNGGDNYKSSFYLFDKNMFNTYKTN